MSVFIFPIISGPCRNSSFRRNFAAQRVTEELFTEISGLAEVLCCRLARIGFAHAPKILLRLLFSFFGDFLGTSRILSHSLALACNFTESLLQCRTLWEKHRRLNDILAKNEICDWLRP